VILLTALQEPDSKSKAPEARGAVNGEQSREADVAAATPEEAFRTFLIAMVTKDEATLRSVTLPTDEFDWLLKGQALPADRIEDFKAQVARQPIRALKPGEVISLPGNRKMTVQPEEVTADRAVLLPEGAPLPNRLQKVDGRWRVDATPIIAGRKAAESARKKATRPAR
jgi:hypothetical protein